MSCPRCKHEHCVKNGKVEGKQRHKCKSCGFGKFCVVIQENSSLGNVVIGIKQR